MAHINPTKKQLTAGRKTTLAKIPQWLFPSGDSSVVVFGQRQGPVKFWVIKKSLFHWGTVQQLGTHDGVFKLKIKYSLVLFGQLKLRARAEQNSSIAYTTDADFENVQMLTVEW